ncbi:sulfur carrier protein ThiS [uncultured Robinsoniella sp.]|uniref:sulfur carrier protein ThiS n=1 Tax=uncultured Robinsoniella sp. TaxID=904190 RepID=UPI00374EFEE9
MKVNGQITTLSETTSLENFLKAKNYNLLRIAVELNGEIVPKGKFDSVVLSDADCLEIVSFVGGG